MGRLKNWRQAVGMIAAMAATMSSARMLRWRARQDADGAVRTHIAELLRILLNGPDARIRGAPRRDVPSSAGRRIARGPTQPDLKRRPQAKSLASATPSGRIDRAGGERRRYPVVRARGLCGSHWRKIVWSTPRTMRANLPASSTPPGTRHVPGPLRASVRRCYRPARLQKPIATSRRALEDGWRTSADR